MTENTEDQESLKSELDLLKERAKLLKISFHPSIGLDTLKAKVNERLADDAPEVKAEVETIPHVHKPLPETAAARKIRKRKEASKLVRIRVTNMDSAKSKHPGEIFTVSNSTVGTFKKYVPFGVDEGFHVPQIILNVMQERMFTQHYTVKGPDGQSINKNRRVREFNIEILDPLTPQELKDLAQRQAMANNISDQ